MHCALTKQNCNKKSACLAKHFTIPNKILQRRTCSACDILLSHRKVKARAAQNQFGSAVSTTVIDIEL